MNSIYEIILFFVIFSIFGWLVEIIFVSIIQKKIVDRGFLIGPYCPIYGFGALLMLFISEKSNLVNSFILIIFYVSALEYITSYLMEKLFKARWWDYSHKKFNFNGRICLSHSVLFGLLGMVYIYLLEPVSFSLISSIPQNVTIIVSSISLILISIDFIISMHVINHIGLNLEDLLQDHTDEINKHVKEFLINKSIFFRRIYSAFPNLDYKHKEK